MEADTPSVLPLEKIEKKPLTEELIEKFKESYGSKPSFVVRLPGRVNLIGEHIDYCGYSVLPMALEQYILIAAKPIPDGTTLSVVNVDSKYSPYEGDTKELNIDTDHGVHWYSYVLCGVRGVTENFKDRNICGMLMAVAGNIPPNSGLSSSSALVCAAALTTVHASQLLASKQELASICARSERYIGTAGGGMDQAIAFLANPGCAKHISFNPLKAADVTIPSGLAIVVAHSLAELNKAASDHFNHRVAECRLASVVLAHKNGLANWKQILVLADVQSELKMSLSDMIVCTKTNLSNDVYSKEEVCKILELSLEELDDYFLPKNTRGIKSFKLRQRATHVFEEALRVQKFQEICLSGGSGEELGKLMNSSHDSLRDLYECSHPQLDELVLSARKSGALGARLTGAGWGGCMVALTTEEHVDTFISSLKANFYSTKPNKKEQEFVFYSQPGGGAAIFQ